MYLISNRDLQVIINAIDVMEYTPGESIKVHNTKRLAKVLLRKLRSKEQIEIKQK